MATSGRELLGWTDQRWTAVEEAAKKALARTAKCRQIIPIGAEQIGAKAVVIPRFKAEGDIAYGPDIVASPIQIRVKAKLNDQTADDEAAVCRLVESAAAQLGFREDQFVIQGVQPGSGPEPAHVPRNPDLPPAPLLNKEVRVPKGGRFNTNTSIEAKGAAPTAAQIATAVRKAKGELETAGRPGPCGLLLHSHLFAELADLTPSGARYIEQVERLIDSSEIAGTSALDGTNVGGRLCGILFRLEPPAVDLVQTARPSIVPLGRDNGETQLQVEEDIVIRILDELAIHRILY
jgi:uncharacterized linocin/CFP29 family protein